METLRRLRRRLAAQEGSLLVEVLVSAALLLTVSAGVVLALQTSHAQGALQRAKALATDVAQTKLDALRSQDYNVLRQLSPAPETVTEGGIDFTVVSKVQPVAQTGAPTGCANARARDYMNLTTTVTWKGMGTRKPVVLQTMVAAPVGAGGGLVVSVTGGAGQPVAGIPVQLSSGGGQATSDASGCARWDAVAAGSGYALTASVDGYVGPDGEQQVNLTGINIAAEQTATKTFAYDRGGQVRVRFQERPSGSSGATDISASSLVPAAVSLANAAATVTKDATATSGATGTYGLFYPFTSSYAVYADTCTAAQPPASAPLSGRPAPVVPAGGVVDATLELPSLGRRFTNNGTLPSASNPITVRVKTACGTIIENRTVKTTDGTLTNPGLPYGTGLTVCARNGANTMRAVANNVPNTTYAAPNGSSTEIRLTGSGAQCPF